MLDLLLANRAYTDHDEPPPPRGPITGGSGGLLAAVRPVIEPWDGRRGTTWIGVGRGRYDRAFVDAGGRELIETPQGPLRHHRLMVDDDTWQGHYTATANAFLWPLLHLAHQPLWRLVPYFPGPLTPSARDWARFAAVNEAFAEAAAGEPGSGACWINDYQLALVPAMLRERGTSRPIGFFLHTPFPDVALAAEALDEEGQERFAAFVEGLLGADLIGFQTEGDADRFREAASRLACAAPAADGTIRLAGREVRVGAYPVGVDAGAVSEAARNGKLPGEVAAWFDDGLPVMVGLERADYTKGIPERLRAIAAAYRGGARFHYAGFASPTRSGVSGYDELAAQIAAAASEAGAEARRQGCRFLHSARSLAWESVVALLREADVVCTSSLADGMNLVPLQAAIAQAGRPEAERGCLIAGRGAGVASAFGPSAAGAMIAVDPLDTPAFARAIVDATGPRRVPMSDAFIQNVREQDASHWGRSFLDGLGDLS